MFQPDCPELRVLGRLHLEKYHVHLNLLARDASKEDLIRAETDVLRINKQMTSHRRRCGHCNQPLALFHPYSGTAGTIRFYLAS
jgi:hypothetical protein